MRLQTRTGSVSRWPLGRMAWRDYLDHGGQRGDFAEIEPFGKSDDACVNSAIRRADSADRRHYSVDRRPAPLMDVVRSSVWS